MLQSWVPNTVWLLQLLFIIFVGHSRLYLSPFQWDNDLVATHPKLDGKLFALEGDLIDNNGYLVELPDLVFNLVMNA